MAGCPWSANKVACGVATGLCSAKLWLEHGPPVAKFTWADLSCLASSNSWRSSLLVFSSHMAGVVPLATWPVWSILLVGLQATLLIQTAIGACLFGKQSVPYTFWIHVVPISWGLLGYVLGPCVWLCIVSRRWLCKAWKSAKQLWMVMALGSGLPNWLWQYKERATAWALVSSLKLTTAIVASLLAITWITCMWS